MIKLFTIAIVSFFYGLIFVIEKPKTQTDKNYQEPLLSDTSRVFYFSFPENKLMDNNYTSEKEKIKNIEVCQGAKVVLEAPVFYANANYYWEGPGEFRSYFPNIVLENVIPNQSGTYKVWIENALVQTLATINLKVSSSKVPQIIQSERGKLLKFEAKGVDSSSSIFWINPDNHVSEQKNELIISSDEKARGEWAALVKTKNCEYYIKL